MVKGVANETELSFPFVTEYLHIANLLLSGPCDSAQLAYTLH